MITLPADWKLDQCYSEGGLTVVTVSRVSGEKDEATYEFVRLKHKEPIQNGFGTVLPMMQAALDAWRDAAPAEVS